MLRNAGLFGIAVAALVGVAHVSSASDHDDGETDQKSRALNLSDHFTFVDGSDLVMTMYFNPRALPSTQYTLSTNARYEFHVSKAATLTTTPTTTDDYVFRFEGAAPNAAGVQQITVTVLQNGTVVGTHTGTSTDFANSKANTVTTNTGTVGTFNLKYFVGMRADAFHFDVIRFFQVRHFLAQRFFGGPGGTTGDATASLAPNCRGDGFFAEGSNPDGDAVNLWNPPSCAPDFTKNYNVTAIVLSVPLANLSGTIFDTWSAITVKQ
jgi:hypothetical protein